MVTKFSEDNIASIFTSTVQMVALGNIPGRPNSSVIFNLKLTAADISEATISIYKAAPIRSYSLSN
jgi:hypothetical protein